MKFHKHFLKAGLLACMSALSHTVLAESSMQIQYIQDSSEAQDVFVDFSHQLSKSTTLRLGGGRTTSPTNSDDLDLQHWNIAFDHRISKRFSAGLEFNNFGQGQDVEFDAITVNLDIDSENWSFNLRPQFRQIHIFIIPLNRQRQINSEGIGATLTYYGIDNWEIAAGFDAYQYDARLELLNIPIIASKIASKAIIVANGLKAQGATFEATYLFDKTDLGLRYGQYKSEVDDTVSRVIAINTNFYQFKPMTLGVEIGSVDSDIDTANYYAGMTLGYNW